MSRYSLFALLTAFLLVTACGPYKPGTNPSPKQETEKVLLLDHGLTYYLNIVKHGVSRMAGGQLMVKLEMENEEDKDVWVDMQVIFRDTQGFELERTDWEPFMFHRRTVTSFQRNSLNPSAADYRVLIRNAKTSK